MGKKTLKQFRTLSFLGKCQFYGFSNAINNKNWNKIFLFALILVSILITLEGESHPPPPHNPKLTQLSLFDSFYVLGDELHWNFYEDIQLDLHDASHRNFNFLQTSHKKRGEFIKKDENLHN